MNGVQGRSTSSTSDFVMLDDSLPTDKVMIALNLATCIKKVDPVKLNAAIVSLVEAEKWPKFAIALLTYFTPIFGPGDTVFNYVVNLNRIQKLAAAMRIDEKDLGATMSYAEAIAFAKIKKSDDGMRYVEIDLNRNRSEEAKNFRITEVDNGSVTIEDSNCIGKPITISSEHFDAWIRWSVNVLRSGAQLYEPPLDPQEVTSLIMEDFCRQYQCVGENETDLGIEVINDLGKMLKLRDREVGAWYQRWYNSPWQLLNELLFENDVVIALLKANKDEPAAQCCLAMKAAIEERLRLMHSEPIPMSTQLEDTDFLIPSFTERNLGIF